MFVLSLNKETLDFFISFISLYLDEAMLPTELEVFEFLEEKCEEKKIIESYNARLITQDEFCSFLLDHLFSKFVLSKSVCSVNEVEIEKIKNKCRSLIFG